ncbi:MAG: hypothetical protein ABJB74_20835 [Gemmatimonas sp.]
MPRRVALLLLGCVVGCSNDVAPILPTENSFAYSNAAIMAIAVMSGHQGAGFFDNAIACPRRGVVEYSTDTDGRRAKFTGCDTGNDIVLDGEVVIKGTLNEASTNQSLTVTRGLASQSSLGVTEAIREFSIKSIGFSAGTSPLALRLITSAVRVSAGDVENPLDARTSSTIVLSPVDITIGRLANAANSVDVLTEADVHRLAVRDLMLLANLLFGETQESARAAHQHVLSCGTTDVAPDAQKPAGYVRVTNTWTSCQMEPGVLVSGTFQQAWDTFSATQLTMRITGPITIGGGVPITTFSSIEWTIVPPVTYPGTGEISGTLVVGGKSRTFRYTVAVDD